MLTLLPESAARSRRSPLAVAWSVILHLGLAAIATAASARHDTSAAASPPVDPDTIYFTVEPARRQRDGGGGSSSSDAPSAPTAPAVPVPVEIPAGLPPIDPGARPVSWAIGDAAADPSRILEGRRGGTGRDGGGPGPGAPYLARPERLAAPLADNPRPRYPGILRTAAIEGAVLIDCVVDTTGVIVLSSVRVIDSDHDAFTAAVREVLPRLRFVPAESGGRKVRQWVRMPFEFRLTR